MIYGEKKWQEVQKKKVHLAAWLIVICIVLIGLSVFDVWSVGLGGGMGLTLIMAVHILYISMEVNKEIKQMKR